MIRSKGISSIPLLQLLLLLCNIFHLSFSQFRNTTSQYDQALKEGTESLQEQIEDHPDVEFFFDPSSALIDNNFYVYDFPESANYRIGIIVDPCRSNSYDCCMNVFGSPEYPALLTSNLEAERVFRYEVIADEDEVAINYVLIDEDGGTIPESAQRTPDDYATHNLSCIAAGNPFSYCQGRNYAFERSPIQPACMDNNSTLDILQGCYATNGTKLSNCVQVAFTSNTFIPKCNEDEGDHCGTFLEIHIGEGTPYQTQDEIIAETRIDVRNVSGYYTTTLPTTWMKNDTKVLCTYTESVLRIGSIVYIQNTAPVCCCPTPYQSTTRVGSFQCPTGPTDNGAFAYVSQTLADTLSVDNLMLDYPYCPIDLTANEDRFMCSVFDVGDRRHYSRNCTGVYQYDPGEPVSWTSRDLRGWYDGPCQYYNSCALATGGSCQLNDLRFTFIGRVGRVTALDNDAIIPQVWVSFNAGRTSYQFSQEDVKLETNTKSMYEIWWVVRSRSEFTVQKRKGFNITNPPCTFDTTNNRYFPYAILRDGVPLDNSLTP